MAGFSVSNNEHLVRSQVWSGQIKDFLEDELIATRFVSDLGGEWSDTGGTFNIPSFGQMEVQDYVEGQAIKYTSMDTGNFTFTVDQYKSSATYITRQMMQDSFYMSQLMSSFVPKQARAIAKAVETDIMNEGPDRQTSADLNNINGAAHRYVAHGTSDVIALEDFARARYALQKANVPMTNLVAVVDPSAEHTLSTLTNLVNVSNNPMWDGIVRDAMGTGMRFRMNVYGFDVWVSNNLKSGISETIDSNSITNGVANLFFSAAPDVMPFKFKWAQNPTVDSEYNKDLQREEYVTTARWGVKLFRPENLVVVLSDTVSALA